MRQDVAKAFMAYVREKDFTGKTWLQILDISRLGEMPESFIEEIQGKLNEVYMLSQMDLKTIDQVKANFSFTQRQIESDTKEHQRRGRGAKSSSINDYLNERKKL